MNRIYNYSVLYLITLLFYIFFNTVGFADPVVFFIFLLSSVYIVFAREELPKARYIKIPEVKQYFKTRINIFGYLMSTILIASSILFILLTITLKLSYGISSLLIWPLLIIFFYLINKYSSKKAFIQSIVDYMRDININYPELNSIIEFLTNNVQNNYEQSKLEDEIVQKFHLNNTSIPILHETILKYFEYVKLVENPVTPDEISELNKSDNP